MFKAFEDNVESGNSTRIAVIGVLTALGLMLVTGLAIFGWNQLAENNIERIARENEEWERRVRAEESLQRESRAIAWSDVRTAKDRWDQLFPWVERTAGIRQRVLVGAAGVDWLLSSSNRIDPFGVAIGAGAIEATSRVFAEAQAQIQMKWPEVVDVLVEMDDATATMLQADAALPGDEQAVATFEHAKEVALRWAEAANSMQHVAAQDFFSVGASAARLNQATAELMAALEELMPAPTPSNDGTW